MTPVMTMLDWSLWISQRFIHFESTPHHTSYTTNQMLITMMMMLISTMIDDDLDDDLIVVCLSFEMEFCLWVYFSDHLWCWLAQAGKDPFWDVSTPGSRVQCHLCIEIFLITHFRKNWSVISQLRKWVIGDQWFDGRASRDGGQIGDTGRRDEETTSTVGPAKH